jgi:hypothetical protein
MTAGLVTSDSPGFAIHLMRQSLFIVKCSVKTYRKNIREVYRVLQPEALRDWFGTVWVLKSLLASASSTDALAVATVPH